MPYELYLFYQLCKDLAFDQRPDYGYLYLLLPELIYSESFQFVIAFQWLLTNQQHSKQAKASNNSGRALSRRMGQVERLEASAGLTQNRRPFELEQKPSSLLILTDEQQKLKLDDQEEQLRFSMNSFFKESKTPLIIKNYQMLVVILRQEKPKHQETEIQQLERK